MNLPGAGEIISIGQPDIETLVIGEIEVVAAEWVLHPVRDPYH
jgi:hypothetical protein